MPSSGYSDQELKFAFPLGLGDQVPSKKVSKNNQVGLKRKASAALNNANSEHAAGKRLRNLALSPQRPRQQPVPLCSLPWFKSTERKKYFDVRHHERTFRDKYDVKEKMGAGSGGTVFAGFRKSDKFGVAIKVIDKTTIMRWGLIENEAVPLEFELLYRAGKAANNSIIKMYEWFETRSHYVLVMERPQHATDVFDYLQKRQMSEAFVCKIFGQLVKAVMACHELDIVHRDIKDENVLINLRTGEAKLIDFGCGFLDDGQAMTQFSGTMEFYPPEWFISNTYYGKDVDIWSLGVLLFSMLESSLPFETPQETVKCKLVSKSNRTISPLCRHLVGSILQFDRSRRPTLEEIMTHPWMTEMSIPPCLTPEINWKTEEVSDLNASNQQDNDTRSTTAHPSISWQNSQELTEDSPQLYLIFAGESSYTFINSSPRLSSFDDTKEM